MARAPAKLTTGNAGTTAVPGPTDVRSTALTILTVLALCAALRLASDVLVPLVLGILASYALEPIVAWMTRRYVPRMLAAAVVMLAFVGSLGVTAWVLADDAAAIVRRVPEASRKLRAQFRGGPPGPVDQVNKLATELERSAAQAAGQTAPPPAPGVTRVQIEEKPIDVRAALLTGSLTLAGSRARSCS
jgi:hypothetical protein